MALVALESGGSRLITAYLRDIGDRKEAERHAAGERIR
jgi:hypothetical protein